MVKDTTTIEVSKLTAKMLHWLKEALDLDSLDETILYIVKQANKTPTLVKALEMYHKQHTEIMDILSGKAEVETHE